MAEVQRLPVVVASLPAKTCDEPAVPKPQAAQPPPAPATQEFTSSRGRALKSSAKMENLDIPIAPPPPVKKEGRGRWDGALSPATPGILPPEDQIKPLPMLPGGGGIFKSAAVAILREEKRLMSTSDITKRALQLGYIRCQGRTPEATMASALYTDVKKKGERSYFSRPEEGLFGLREWEVGAVPFEESPDSKPSKALTLPDVPTSKLIKPKSRRTSSTGGGKPPRVAKTFVSIEQPALSGAESEEHVSSRSMDENLLLLLDAADELQKAETCQSMGAYGSPSKSGVPLKKRRWSETATSPAPAKLSKRRPAGALPPRAPKRIGGQLVRPKPLQFPLHFACYDKLSSGGPRAVAPATTPVPPTPDAEAEPSPSSRPADSQDSTQHDAHPSSPPVPPTCHDVQGTQPARSLYGTTTETSCEGGDCEETATSVGGTGCLSEPTQLARDMIGNPWSAHFGAFAAGVARPGVVGHLLAASQFATRLLHANALVAQMEAALGTNHPLVGKVHLAKARICQMEGSQLALLEAERALLRAQEVLHSAAPDSINVDEEVAYLLTHIRDRAYSFQQCY